MALLSVFFANYIYIFPLYFAISIFDEFNTPRFHPAKRKWIVSFLICSAMLIPMFIDDGYRKLIVRQALFLSVIVAFYKWRPLRILLSFGLYLLLMYLSEGLSVYLFLPFGIQAERLIDIESLEFIVYNCICMAIMCGIFLLFLKVRHAVGDRHSKKHWLQIIFCIFFVAVTMAITYLRTSNVRTALFDSSTRNGLIRWLFYSNSARLLINILLFSVLLALYLVLYQFMHEVRLAKAGELINHQLQIEMDKTVQWRKEILVLRQIRHDMKNHIAVIDALGRSGEHSRQRRYIDEVLRTMEAQDYDSFMIKP